MNWLKDLFGDTWRDRAFFVLLAVIFITVAGFALYGLMIR